MKAVQILRELYEDYRGGAKFNNEEQDELIYPNDFTIINIGLFGMCRKPNETALVFHIGAILKRNNCIFYLSDAYKNSSSVRSAISALKRMRVIYSMDKTNFYFMNPLYMRRGEVLSVLLTTIKMLENEELTEQSIRDRNKIKIEKREMKQAG